MLAKVLIKNRKIEKYLNSLYVYIYIHRYITIKLITNKTALELPLSEGATVIILFLRASFLIKQVRRTAYNKLLIIFTFFVYFIIVDRLYIHNQ
jgi:hypothetical protein